MSDSLEYTGDSETVAVGTDMRQPNAGGVPKRKWYIAIVKQHTEEHCCQQVQKLGYEAYVASQKEIRRYANRHRRTVSRVVISGIVFIKATEEERIQILKTCPSIPVFLTNKAGKPNKFGRRPMAIVPDEQIATLQFMLYHANSPVCFTNIPIKQGDRIRVTRGPFTGFEGFVEEDDKQTELVINIDFLGAAKTSIHVEDIEKII
ncbi:MAG: UpxY family transcription antiterminator [Prevotellaceae bacterium]|nr:UpxY family transcription antiterminator [Prevotellaceae bacterium]